MESMENKSGTEGLSWLMERIEKVGGSIRKRMTGGATKPVWEPHRRFDSLDEYRAKHDELTIDQQRFKEAREEALANYKKLISSSPGELVEFRQAYDNFWQTRKISIDADGNVYVLNDRGGWDMVSNAKESSFSRAHIFTEDETRSKVEEMRHAIEEA